MSHIDTKLVSMGKIFRLTPWQRFMHIILPSLIPFLLAAAKLVWVWPGRLASLLKFYLNRAGLWAPKLRYAQINLETAEVLAWTAAAGNTRRSYGNFAWISGKAFPVACRNTMIKIDKLCHRFGNLRSGQSLLLPGIRTNKQSAGTIRLPD